MSTSSPTSATRPARRATHLPGLDGLRGLAVAAVVAYHLGLSGSKGGFLGVDVFFVVSGFLVTMLLSAELAKNNRINIKEFWVRRIRRLMPALFGLLAACGVIYGFRVQEKLAAGRLDLAAGAVYFSNWRMILSSTSYFDQLGRPPLTRHLWSLAIEGQFYLAWPVVLVGLAYVSDNNRKRMAWLTGLLGVLSITWGAVLFRPDLDPSRVYFGTDTRLVAVLFGAALALVLTPNGQLRVPTPREHRVLSVAGVIGLAALGTATVFVGDQWASLYRGGFGLVAAITVVVVWASVSPGTPLARLLSTKVLTTVGVRSYSLYLWHWPVVAMTQSGLDVSVTTNRWVLVAIRLGISAVLTEISYRLIEVPFRQRLFGRWLASFVGGPNALRRTPKWYAGTLAGAILVTGTAAGVSRASLNDGIADSLRNPDDVVAVSGDGSAQVSLPDLVTTIPTPTAVPTTFPAPPPDPALATTTLPPAAPAAGAPAPPPDASVAAGPTGVKVAEQPTTTLPRPPGVLAIGDSIMKGAATSLAARLGEGSVVDSAVSRQFTVGVKTYKKQTAGGRKFGAVVIHLGNNGVPSKRQFQALLDTIGPTTPVLFVTMRETREWAPKLNALLREMAKTNPNVKVLEWSKAADKYEYLFAKDRLHLTKTGGIFYSDLIVWGLRQAGYRGLPSAPTTLVPTTTVPTATAPTTSLPVTTVAPATTAAPSEPTTGVPPTTATTAPATTSVAPSSTETTKTPEPAT
jgi:peptidoglycan/LPS O-acetylase OafA/YrhL